MTRSTVYCTALHCTAVYLKIAVPPGSPLPRGTAPPALLPPPQDNLLLQGQAAHLHTCPTDIVTSLNRTYTSLTGKVLIFRV